jgi:ribosomal protein L11 methylase PrmA
MYRMLSTTVLLAGFVLGPAASGQLTAQEANKQVEPDRTPDCVYVGTPYDVIDKMLQTASIQKSDLVYDLGCGDGRIVVSAAKRYGCRGVGYDISPQRIEESLENVRKNQVGHLVKIEKQDIFTLDLSPVNVIMLYLLPSMNKKLIPQLEKLRPGSRIVSHDYRIEGIAADKSVTMSSLEDGAKHYVYLYTAPLKEEESE